MARVIGVPNLGFRDIVRNAGIASSCQQRCCQVKRVKSACKFDLFNNWPLRFDLFDLFDKKLDIIKGKGYIQND